MEIRRIRGQHTRTTRRTDVNLYRYIHINIYNFFFASYLLNLDICLFACIVDIIYKECWIKRFLKGNRGSLWGMHMP